MYHTSSCIGQQIYESVSRHGQSGSVYRRALTSEINNHRLNRFGFRPDNDVRVETRDRIIYHTIVQARPGPTAHRR